MRHFFLFQLENCGQPGIITKDLSLVIYGRDARTAPRTLKQLFSSSYKNSEANRLTGVYELALKRANEAGSPGSCLFACFIFDLDPFPPSTSFFW